MSDRFLEYLRREHSRLARAIDDAQAQRFADDVGIARLKKLKLAIKDQISEIESDRRREQPLMRSVA